VPLNEKTALAPRCRDHLTLPPMYPELLAEPHDPWYAIRDDVSAYLVVVRVVEVCAGVLVVVTMAALSVVVDDVALAGPDEMGSVAGDVTVAPIAIDGPELPTRIAARTATSEIDGRTRRWDDTLWVPVGAPSKTHASVSTGRCRAATLGQTPRIRGSGDAGRRRPRGTLAGA
jgi:hypothetical protein